MNGPGETLEDADSAADFGTTDQSETESESPCHTINGRISAVIDPGEVRGSMVEENGYSSRAFVRDQDCHNYNLDVKPDCEISSDDPGTPPPNNRDSSSAKTSRSHQQYKLTLLVIEQAKKSGAIILDLSNKGLTVIPKELLELQNLQYLYLAENKLQSLPEDFFNCLSELQWLDLRQNYLVSLPHTFIGRHQCLRTLLLQGNNLKTLPLELGLVATLRGLNIAENPLEFPPLDVIERGTQAILQFLREVLHAKSQGSLVGAVETMHIADMDSESVASSVEWGNSQSSRNSFEVPSRRLLNRSDSCDSRGTFSSDQSDLVGPVPQSASLQRRQSYNEMKQQQTEKFRRAGALGTLEKKSAKAERQRRRNMRVSRYPEPPAGELVEQRYLNEKRLAKIRDLREKQEIILQRRKDVERMRNWRDDARRMQMRKMRDAMMNGGPEKVKVVEKAPFGTAAEEMRIMTNQERIAREVKEKHEKMRRAMSPASQAKAQEERMARDHELQRRIRSHVSTMSDRRRLPKGNPQEEMLAAKRELEMAEQLQREVAASRKNLEYRFTAFTGELPLQSHSHPGI